MIVASVSSGTSADAIDVAVVEAHWDGPDVALEVLLTAEVPWPVDLREQVLELLPPATTDPATLCRLDNDVGRALADATADALRTCGVRADLVVSPGQTLFHDVVGGACRGTLQVGQPGWIAERVGAPVVSDLRASDVAAGGHGAPLAGTFDALWLSGAVPGSAAAALNLGGIANVSVVDTTGALLASFDTGPGNCLLDLAAARVSGGRLRHDVDGELAAAGTVHGALLARLLEDPYLRRPAPKSTGREYFSAALLDRALADVGGGDAGTDPTGPDLLATLTEFTARTVADAVAGYRLEEVVVSGGGVRNPRLMGALGRRLAPTRVAPSTAYGVDPSAKEALLWCLLGFLTWHGCPGTVPVAGGGASTGARSTRVLGRISPGPGPLALPEPRTRATGSLRLCTAGGRRADSEA